MVEYTVKRKLIKLGGSVVVTLPQIWARAHKLVAGNEVHVAFSGTSESLKVIPIGKEKVK